MKEADLDTKEVQVTLYILNEKVFELDGCPDWAQWAAVDADGKAYWYEDEPRRNSSIFWTSECARSRSKYIIDISFDAADWQNSLIRRPQKVLEVTMSDIEKKFGCKVKIVKEK